MQRHRYDKVESLVSRQTAQQVPAERPGERLHSPVLQQMNQVAQGAAVGAKGIRGIKSTKAAAAESAAAFGIEWETILEWRPATYAKVIGRKWLRDLKAGMANRDPADFPQGLPANSAVIREEKGKKGVRG